MGTRRDLVGTLTDRIYREIVLPRAWKTFHGTVEFTAEELACPEQLEIAHRVTTHSAKGDK